MNKLIALAVLAVADWILAVVVALEEGPIALTVGLALLGTLIQLSVLGMVVAEARPVQVPGDG